MAFFPKIQRPCPYKGNLAAVLDGDFCRMCKRQVFDITDWTDDARVAFLAGCEEEMDIAPAPAPRDVLVVGAGPAGMECARVAALRGHRVTLCDRASHLGGLLAQTLDLVAADRAAIEMAAEIGGLRGLQRVEDVGARIVSAVALRAAGIVLERAHAITSAGSLSATRSFVSPRRMRPLTVPIGAPSMSAIWLCVKPPK